MFKIMKVKMKTLCTKASILKDNVLAKSVLSSVNAVDSGRS